MDTLKKVCVRNVLQIVIYNACDPWHTMCFSFLTEKIQVTKTQKQDRRWYRGFNYSRLQRERNQVNKKVWRKIKEMLFKIRYW